MDSPTEKKCYMCGETKGLSEFYRNRTRPDGRQTDCKSCHNKAGLARYHRHPERQRRNTKGWKSRHPDETMLFRARARAKRSGVPFALTSSDIVVPEACPALGIPLTRGEGKGIHSSCSPSLDRIVPELGYVPGNVAVISMRANRIKNDATLAELEAVAAWLRKVGATNVT